VPKEIDEIEALMAVVGQRQLTALAGRPPSKLV